jgi:hypothetical protein
MHDRTQPLAVMDTALKQATQIVLRADRRPS